MRDLHLDNYNPNIKHSLWLKKDIGEVLFNLKGESYFFLCHDQGLIHVGDGIWGGLGLEHQGWKIQDDFQA